MTETYKELTLTMFVSTGVQITDGHLQELLDLARGVFCPTPGIRHTCSVPFMSLNTGSDVVLMVSDESDVAQYLAVKMDEVLRSQRENRP